MRSAEFTGMPQRVGGKLQGRKRNVTEHKS